MRNKPEKRRLGFWAIYAIVFSVLAMGIIGGLLYLRKYLAAYEESRPMRVAQGVIEQLATDSAPTHLFSGEVSEFERGTEIGRLYKKLTEGKAVDCAEKAGESGADAPVFSVRADNKEICKLTLAEAGRNDFFRCWQVVNIEFIGGNPLMLTLPESVKLKVNGVSVGEEYIAERDIPLAGYADFPEKAPSCVRYELPTLYFEPEVTLESEDCAPVAVKDDKGWSVKYNAEGGETEKAFASAAAKAYVAFASDEEAPITELDKYLIPGSTLRARMLSFDRKYFARHDRAEMRNVKASDYCVYGEGLCSVLVTYDYFMVTDGKEYTEQAAMTMYMLKTAAGWRLAEVATLSE